MIVYSLLRAVSRLALRWFYRDIEVLGLERLPTDAPVILVANHPNALVDALVIGHAVPHQVRLTAKGTFFDHPMLGPLFRSLGIIPLHRARDAAGSAGSKHVRGDRGAETREQRTQRNVESFRDILDALQQRRTVLIFPEGTTHSGPELVPLKSGAARLALAAHEERGIRDVRIIPVGLVFEDKSRPRSGVLVQFGTPLTIGHWVADRDDRVSHAVADRDDRVSHAVADLTREIDQRLREVTLNFSTPSDAAAVRRVARLLSEALDPPRPVAAPHRSVASEFVLIQRLERVRRLMAVAEPAAADSNPQAGLASRARELLGRIENFERVVESHGIAVNDVEISLSPVMGARFAAREGLIAAGFAPLAWWGWLNHRIPFRAALAMGRRHANHLEEPAMHTIVWGLVLVTVAYALQTSLVAWWAGGWWAALYLLSLPPSASWELRYRSRLARTIGRARTYLRFRRDPALQARLATDLARLRQDTREIALALPVAATAPEDRIPRDPSATRSVARPSADP